MAADQGAVDQLLEMAGADDGAQQADNAAIHTAYALRGHHHQVATGTPETLADKTVFLAGRQHGFAVAAFAGIKAGGYLERQYQLAVAVDQHHVVSLRHATHGTDQAALQRG